MSLSYLRLWNIGMELRQTIVLHTLSLQIIRTAKMLIGQFLSTMKNI